jgi:hypothetical protein
VVGSALLSHEVHPQWLHKPTTRNGKSATVRAEGNLISGWSPDSDSTPDHHRPGETQDCGVSTSIAPLEDRRARQAYGVPSEVNNLLVINQAIAPGRITAILVNEPLGF